MNEIYSFGEWVKQRRQSLHLTQRELATYAACAIATIKKIEADERRPSNEMAQMLGEALGVPSDWQQRFIACARGQRSVEALRDMATSKVTQETLTPTLPQPLTPLIGRDKALEEIIDLLMQPNCRLITLVGQGGIGKTRLALEIAHHLSQANDYDVVFVPLAGITSGGMIPSTIASALNIVDNQTQLFTYLEHQRLFLILDNCEHLQDDVTWFSQLLQQAPDIKLLATSRERLQLAEEWIYAVPELKRAYAVELFEQSARRSASDFTGEEQADAIEQICSAVGNLPLALELAASWLPMMTPAQIVEHIGHDIDFLATTVRNIPARQRSIRAVFDHSWKLLSASEQDVLMRLSLFRGGWLLDTGQSAAGASPTILRALLDKSLIRVDDNGRYTLHELTRQYAADKLAESGQELEAVRHYLETFVELTYHLRIKIMGPEGIEAFRRCDQERDNIHAALQYAIDYDQLQFGWQVLDNMFRYWLRRGLYQEAEQWNTAMQKASDETDDVLRCASMLSIATFLALQGLYAEGLGWTQAAQAMAGRLGDDYIQMILYRLLTQSSPTIQQVTTYFREAEKLMLAWDHPTQQAEIAVLNGLYGDRLLAAGEKDEAIAHYQKSLDMLREVGNVDVIAYALGNLARVDLQEGRLQQAYDSFVECVAISRAVGNRVGIADWLQQLGRVALYLDDFDQAEACFEETLGLYEEIGNLRGQAEMLSWLGHVAFVCGDLETAQSFVHDSLQHTLTIQSGFSRLGNTGLVFYSWDILQSLVIAALVAEADGNAERTATLYYNIEHILTAQNTGEVAVYGMVENKLLNMLQARVAALPDEISAFMMAQAPMPIITLLQYALNID